MDLAPLIDGTTQKERRLKSLMPDFIDLDERNMPELLKFMTDISSGFNYYNHGNAIDGNWEGFFTSDVRILLVIISGFDVLAHINLYSKYEKALQLSENSIEVRQALKDIYDFLKGMEDKLKKLHVALLNVSDPDKMSDEISSFSDQVSALIEDIKEPFEAFDKGLNAAELNEEAVIRLLPNIKTIFNDLNSKFNHLQGISKLYLKNDAFLSKNYQPHLALCIAFLHLYGHLTQRLNLTTRNHLDLYYKRILGLQLNKALPDNVHLVFEKDAVVPHVVLEAGEQLLARIAGQQNPATFILNDRLMVTAVQICELHTLYLAEHEIIKNENGTIKEIQVYNGTYPCITAAALLKSKIPAKSWPVLGEDQDGLSSDARTMDDTDMGILLASPLLYQPEGRRTISLHLHLQEDSYNTLMDYFANYSKVNNMEVQAVNHQLLSGAFIIDYTDTKGWKVVEKYSVILNNDFRKLEFEIQINNSDEFVDIYKPEVHGGNFDIHWPIFRLLLNNYAVNNPFTFLRTIKIERVSITVDVKGSRAVRLQNNVGQLSAANPGQLFGPQPTVGSYIDIKNSNIFNRYTKSFCIRLDWIDLPRDAGGWEAYYSAYKNGILNNSFRIKLSTLTDGRFVPNPLQQQEFSLFEIDDHETGILSSTTQLDNINIKILGLVRKPLLDKDELTLEKSFTEGAVRLELTAPKDAFGHKLFPQIFPETVLHNAKVLNRKRPLPNQPYIPMVNAITIDYVLEHSEVLGPGSAKSQDEDDLKMFHIYPFGSEEIYPGKKGSPYSLIPDFDHENNLYIGLTGVKPGQELSLLLQMEENNFTSLERKIEQVFWSYLDKNTWVYLPEKDVLSDSTNNFINTGIVKIKLPADLKIGNSILSSKSFWIRASARGNGNVKSSILGIYTQAGMATRLVTENTRTLNIPAGSIKMFKSKVNGILSITQPFPSFGGRPGETDEQFYIRVSERLRHKQKLVTSLDIEQAILERFPQILMARCIRPYEYTAAYIEKYEPDPRVILIPKEQDNGLFFSDEPRVNLSLRYQVKKFLESSIPFFLKVDIRDPVYEKIKVICTVKFEDSSLPDIGMYVNKLNDDIKRYLCPWLYDEGVEFKIGTGIYMTEMLNYIKNRSYIKYITGFSIVHFYFEDATDDTKKKARVSEYIGNIDVYIKGSLPESVLIPNPTHLITVDNPKYTRAKKVGIGEFAITDELLVNQKKVTLTDENPPYQPGPDTGANSFFDLRIIHNLDEI